MQTIHTIATKAGTATIVGTNIVADTTTVDATAYCMLAGDGGRSGRVVVS
jgi:hypothetical protein